MWDIYIRRGKVYVPTQFRAEAGFCVSGEPVHVSDLSDLDGIAHSIAQVLQCGTRVIATPPAESSEKWAVLKYAGVSSVAAFEKWASCWTIFKGNGTYKFGPVNRLSQRGWEVEPRAPFLLSDNLAIPDIAREVARKIVEIEQA